MPHDEFVAEMRSRGGGLTAALVRDAMAAFSQHYGTDRLTLTRLVLKSEDASVTARLRLPRHPDQVDELTFTEDDLDGPSPVKVSAAEDLDRMSFTVRDVPALEDVVKMVDTALAETKYYEGYVETIEVTRTASAPKISVAVSSSRADAVVTFKANGRFTKVTRS
ncbi:hypothetical protein ABZ806_44800 [Spirillospora sp. NPDC047418]|jgi:hypothetical protein